MSLRRSTYRPLVVLISWTILVSIATIVPVTSVAAQPLDAVAATAATGANGTDIAQAGVRTSAAYDAPAQVLAFRFAQPADCLYDNSCPEQVGNQDEDDPGPPPRDPYQDARDSRDDALDKIVDQLEAPNWITFPGFDAQLVGLESFLHIESGWEEKSVTGEQVGDQRVTVYATPIHSVWEFTSSEGTVEVVCTETEPHSTGDHTPLCGKEWEHSSSVIGPVKTRVRMEYRLHWTHGYTTGWQLHDDPKWSVERDLIVREALARGIDENLEFDPPDDVRPEVAEPEKIDCGWGAKFAAALIPGLGCEPIQLVWDLFTGFLGGCIDAVIGRIGDLWDTVTSAVGDPVGFIKDQVGGLKAMYDLLLEDPLALMEELGRDFFELDEDDDPTTWNEDQWASWAGEFICAKAFDYLTGQASSRLLRYLDGKIRPDGPNGPNNNPDLDPDNPDADPNDPDPDPDNDGDAPTCPTRNSSFPAGTEVVMGDGALLPIEDIRPGDHVLSFDVDTSVWEPKLVLDQWSYDDRGPPATATLVDGSTVTATHDHQFYAPETGEWIELQHLRAGVALLSPTGLVELDHVSVGPAHPWTVWELTVADNHNFTVLADETPVLVHNCDHQPPTEIDNDDLFPETAGSTNYRQRLIDAMVEAERERLGDAFDEAAVRERITRSLDDHQVHHVLPKNVPNREFLDELGIDINDPQNLKPLPCNGTTCGDLPTHQGSHGNYSDAIGEMLQRIEDSGGSPASQRDQVAALLQRAHEALHSGQPPLRNTDGATVDAWIEALGG